MGANLRKPDNSQTVLGRHLIPLSFYQLRPKAACARLPQDFHEKHKLNLNKNLIFNRLCIFGITDNKIIMEN